MTGGYSKRANRLGLVAAVSLALLLGGCSKKDEEPGRRAARPAQEQSSPNVTIKTYDRFPNVTLKALDGSEYNLSNFRGKVVVLCLFATWHNDCVAQIPALNALHDRIKNARMTVIGLVIDDDGKTALRKLQMTQPISFPVYCNGAEIISRIGGTRKLPTTYVLLRDGYIYERVLGKQSLHYFEEKLREISAQRL